MPLAQTANAFIASCCYPEAVEVLIPCAKGVGETVMVKESVKDIDNRHRLLVAVKRSAE